MRQIIKDFVKICSETLPINEPIYDFGSLQTPKQVGFADLRPYFKDKKYVGADIRKGPGVDVILDLHNINLSADSVGTALIMDALEHVEFVRKAISEVYRVLKKDGILIMSSVMNFGIHDFPSDYWRFTPAGFESLLGDFEMSFVGDKGDKKFPHTVIGIGFKSKINIDEFEKGFNEWQIA